MVLMTEKCRFCFAHSSFCICVSNSCGSDGSSRCYIRLCCSYDKFTLKVNEYLVFYNTRVTLVLMSFEFQRENQKLCRFSFAHSSFGLNVDEFQPKMLN